MKSKHTHPPRRKCFRVKSFMLGTCGVTATSGRGLGSVKAESAVDSVDVIAESLHAVGEARGFGHEFIRLGVTLRDFLFPTVDTWIWCVRGVWWIW
jgi:hypothetical protein